MTPAQEAARRIALTLNDQKWYEIERAIEEAVLEGEQRGRAVDEYAPPVGGPPPHGTGRMAHVTENTGTVREPVMTALKPISGGFVPGTLVYMGLGFEQPARLIDNNDGSHLEPVPGDRQSYEEG